MSPGDGELGELLELIRRLQELSAQRAVLLEALLRELWTLVPPPPQRPPE